MTEDKTKTHLKSIENWLNNEYSQDSEKYCIFRGPKPEVVRYDDHTAISFWACGAIVCIYDQMYFIGEDDGNWFLNDGMFNARDDYKGWENYKGYNIYGFQDSFSIGWANSFADAMTKLNEYVKENGEPVYFSGIEKKIICHYRL